MFLHGGGKLSLELIKHTISSRFKLAEFLVKREEPDFLALVIFIIDNLQHFYWNGDILYHAWLHVDKELGSFISEYLMDSYIFIVSDHGFTEGIKTFFISKFLENLGLIRYRMPFDINFFLKSMFKI